MSGEALTIVAPDPRRHGAEIYDLAGKVFSGNGYYRFRDFCRDGYICGSHYDWAASRIGLADGRIVTHWGVWGYPMRIGTARVRAGGIGMVATDGDYRKRGLMAGTARASIAAMRDLGYDLSILFGIADFYDRFGYVRAWSDTTYTVRLADLPAARPAARLRRFKPVERGDISAIYNRENRTATGTAVRPTYPRCVYPWSMEGVRWTDARGRTAGYVVCGVRAGAFKCVECGGDVETVLRVLAAEARKRLVQEVQFDLLPHDSAVLKRVRRGNCRAETVYHRAGGAMVATINLARTLAKMAAELGRRLRASALAGWRGDLVLDDGRERVTLAIGRLRVALVPARASRHAIRGGDHLAQLLIGTDEPAEVIEAARMRVTGDARQLAAALFPAQHPQLSLRDRF